jgi:ParB-like chromosome segregation protein Spo0J
MTRPELNIARVPIDGLKVDPLNARLHPARNLEILRESLRRFGQQKPIVVDSSGVVRAGNGTLEAAKSLGWSEIDVVYTKLVDADAEAYAIADNRASDLATWDPAVLELQFARMDLELAQLLGADDADDVETAESGTLDLGEVAQSVRWQWVVALMPDEQSAATLLLQAQSAGGKVVLSERSRQQ